MNFGCSDSASRSDHQLPRRRKPVHFGIKAILFSTIGFGAGCGIAALQQLADVGQQLGVAFVKDAAGAMLGTSFVAEGKVYTAKHVAERGSLKFEQVGPDLVSIGDSPLKGYPICHKPHFAADKMRVTVGPWPGVAPEFEALLGNPSSEDGELSLFIPQQSLWAGVSGSPVICQEHNAVIGCITGTLQTNWMAISRFPIEEK